MIRYERRFRVLALALSGFAGFVDAVGFLLSGGLFVSFMSGNSTRLAVAFAQGRGALAATAAGLLAAFLAGVIAGALVAARWPGRRKALVLGSVSVVLLGAGLLVSLGGVVAGTLAMACAMGALNNVFLREGEVAIGVTYMTGTLVRAGQRIAGALRGEGPRDWPWHLALWAGLVGGAAAGAAVMGAAPALGPWMAAGLGLVLMAVAGWLEQGRR